MNPIEAAVRAVCRHIGVSPDDWRAFAEIGTVATTAFVDALPDDLRGAVHGYVEALGGDPCSD